MNRTGTKLVGNAKHLKFEHQECHIGHAKNIKILKKIKNGHQNQFNYFMCIESHIACIPIAKIVGFVA